MRRIFLEYFRYYIIYFSVRVSQSSSCNYIFGGIVTCIQLLYAGEGEARRPEENFAETSNLKLTDKDEKPGTIVLKGHEFLQISYHMPTNCEICPKPLWHMFRPPSALECRRKLKGRAALPFSPNPSFFGRIIYECGGSFFAF